VQTNTAAALQHAISKRRSRQLKETNRVECGGGQGARAAGRALHADLGETEQLNAQG
jgi:hypothetical protein